VVPSADDGRIEHQGEPIWARQHLSVENPLSNVAIEASGRPPGVPVLQLDAVGDVDGGVAAKGDDEVDGAKQVGIDRSRILAGNVDT
jgi:hypothetical protein